MHETFFSSNRQRLVETVGGGIIVLAGNHLMQRSNDMSFCFQQDANFWYVTGINHPNWRLVINGLKSILIAPTVDKMHKIFDGGLSFADAKAISGVDKVIDADAGRKLIDSIVRKGEIIYTLGKSPHAKHYDFVLNPAQQMLKRELKKSGAIVKDCYLELAKLRAVKQPTEIDAIRRAVELTVEAFSNVKNRLGDFKHEYEVEAEFSYYFRSRGASGHAYSPIIASGKNACTLHYDVNNDRLNTKDMILLDVGASVDGYAADITRTYTLGKPSKRQKEIHSALEKAHHKIIALLQPALRIDEYSKSVDEIMKSTLKDLGLLAADKNYRTYFPHAISHGLGIDVHDSLGDPKEFLEGMVLTVEPGIYIPEEGIGVRIEDDILITKNGHENLSAALPTSL